jgi:hypothetical protein
VIISQKLGNVGPLGCSLPPVTSNALRFISRSLFSVSEAEIHEVALLQRWGPENSESPKPYAGGAPAYPFCARAAAIEIARVSTQKQGLGLEAQQAAIARFAAQEGFEIAETFVEKQSGKDDDQRLFATARRIVNFFAAMSAARCSIGAGWPRQARWEARSCFCRARRCQTTADLSADPPHPPAPANRENAALAWR